MKSMFPPRAQFLSALLITTLAGTVSANSQIVYSDAFTRTGALAGSTPDVVSGTNGGTAGATWISNTAWTLDGSVASTTLSTSANAYLPFTPDLGTTYNLTLNMTAAAGTWLAAGFMIQATNPGTISGAQGFQQNPPLAVYWLLLQTDSKIQAFGGGGNSDQKLLSATMSWAPKAGHIRSASQKQAMLAITLIVILVQELRRPLIRKTSVTT